MGLRVLVVGVTSWAENSGSKTLMDFFGDWGVEDVALIYTRGENSTSRISNHYFQISELELAKSIGLRRKPVGKRVVSSNMNVENKEQQQIQKIKRNRIPFLWLIRNLIWTVGNWKTDELNMFIQEFKPDVLFFPIFPYAHMTWIQQYVYEQVKCPVISYIADDNYSFLPEWYNPSFLLSRMVLRSGIRKILKNTSHLFVIAPQLIDEYKKIYSGNFDVLTRGLEVSNRESQTGCFLGKTVIDILYTGNLYIGRGKTIVEIAKAIKELNQESNKICFKLKVYSQSVPSNRMLKKLNIENCSEFCGRVSGEETILLQKQADILLFVEGIDIFNRYKARLSFSTKLTDYMAAKKCIVGVGNKQITPIKYLEDNDIGIVAYDKRTIQRQLGKIAENPMLLKTYAERAYKWGMEHHDSHEMKELLYKTCREVCRKNDCAAD